MDSVSQDIVDGSLGFARWMSENKPDMKVRLLVASWPDDAPRGAISAFCRKHAVSRSWFHKVLSESRANGKWAAMERGSTKPKTSPASTQTEMVRLAVEVRAELEKSGFDYGPLSVQAKLRRRGFAPPSRATLARIFTRAGVVVPEPKKKPRSAMRRFVYPAPNCLWQIDAMEWTLDRGRKIAIFQVLDDHSRRALASLVATGETSEGAIRVVKLAMSRHGIPQKFLSDNGVAFNPSRRGRTGKLLEFLKSLGVVPITGKPSKPTTQGKNERSHQTLQKYLNKQPPASTMAELQAHVDTYDDYYNTEREHQALAPGMTPREAWDATPIATPPTPPAPEVAAESEWHQVRRVVQSKGAVTVLGIECMIGKDRAGQSIHVIYNDDSISFFDHKGTEIITHPRPPLGTRYLGNNQPRGFMATHKPSTKS